MANDPTALPRKDAADTELALWMLERMRDSDGFLGVIRAARRAGGADILDTPDYIARHTGRLAPLYQGGPEELVDLPVDVIAKFEAIAKRDLLSCNEELIEKALAAFLAKNPKIAAGVPADWPTTFDAARAEIEGRTTGTFKPGFTAELAAAARSELDRQAAAEKSRGAERDGRES